MSLGQAIAPHLPYLRRYGRAISGSQQSGDALVARLLETLVAHPDAVDIGDNLRIQLYRMVHDNFGLMADEAANRDAATDDLVVVDDVDADGSLIRHCPIVRPRQDPGNGIGRRRAGGPRWVTRKD